MNDALLHSSGWMELSQLYKKAEALQASVDWPELVWIYRDIATEARLLEALAREMASGPAVQRRRVLPPVLGQAVDGVQGDVPRADAVPAMAQGQEGGGVQNSGGGEAWGDTKRGF